MLDLLAKDCDKVHVFIYHSYISVARMCRFGENAIIPIYWMQYILCLSNRWWTTFIVRNIYLQLQIAHFIITCNIYIEGIAIEKHPISTCRKEINQTLLYSFEITTNVAYFALNLTGTVLLVLSNIWPFHTGYNCCHKILKSVGKMKEYGLTAKQLIQNSMNPSSDYPRWYFTSHFSTNVADTVQIKKQPIKFSNMT